MGFGRNVSVVEEMMKMVDVFSIEEMCLIVDSKHR